MLIGDIYCAPRAADYVDADGSRMFICDGRAINRIAYGALFTLCGVAFGPGDGVTTFNIPQFGTSLGMMGRSPIGASPAGGYALGAQGGVETHGHTCAGVIIDHVAGDTTAENTLWVTHQAGATAVAAPGHIHTVTLPPGWTHTVPDPEDAGIVAPVLGTGFFIKVL